MEQEIHNFMKRVIEKNPNEKEFLQAVEEVAEAVIPFMKKNEKPPINKYFLIFFFNINLTLSILKFLNECIFFLLLTLSFKEITLSEKITSAFETAFLGSL